MTMVIKVFSTILVEEPIINNLFFFLEGTRQPVLKNFSKYPM